MINKINRLNFSVISSKLGENNINNDTDIPIINNKSNFKSMIDDFKNSYRTNRYWGNSGNYGVSLPEKSMTISEYLEKPILDNIDYDVFHVRPQTSITWNSSSGLSSTKIGCNCLTVIGSTVIAGTDFGGLYYSENNGHTWQNSDIQSSNFYCLTVIGSTVIAGSSAGKGLYYSENNGKTWNQSNIQSDSFRCLITIGSTVIAGSQGKGLYYSEDNGKTWNISNIQSGNFICLTVIGSTVIAGSQSDKGLYYSENNGKTWNQSNNVQSGSFHCLTTIGSTVIAGSWYHKGIYYSEDNGKTWNQSDIQSDDIRLGDFDCLTVIGSTVIAGNDSKGLYYSEDNGKTWNQSDMRSGHFYCLTVIGSTVIAGGGNGLYYSEDNGKTWNKSDIQLRGVNCLTTIVSKSDSTCTCIAGTLSSDSTHLFYTESISEPLEFKEEREDALEFLNSSDPKNEQLIYNSILSKLFLDWLDYTLVKDCSLNTNYTKYKDEAIVKESIDDNILTNNRIVYGNGPYFRFTDKYKC